MELEIKSYDGIIGLADIISSSAIANQLPLTSDWKFKEDFFAAVLARAEQFQVQILNHMGDGFAFLIPRSAQRLDVDRLIRFANQLTLDFRVISQRHGLNWQGIKTGLRWGATTGRVCVGQLISGLSPIVAGPTVALAARLARVASADEIVVDKSIASLVGLRRADSCRRGYRRLKGFKYTVAFHFLLGDDAKPETDSVNRITMTHLESSALPNVDSFNLHANSNEEMEYDWDIP